jgi:hypothetical protein
MPLVVEDYPLAHCTKFASTARMLTSIVRHDAMNYILCLMEVPTTNHRAFVTGVLKQG